MENKLKRIRLIKCLIYIVIPIIVQIVLSSIYVYTSVKDYAYFIDTVKNNNDKNNLLIPVNSVYTYWIGGFGDTKAKIAFFYIMIFGAILPCLFLIPFKKGINNLEKITYKHFFLLSGFSSVIPLIVNFLCSLSFIPAIKPDSVYDIYFGVIKTDVFSGLFYSHPIIYEFIYIVLIFILCGCLGCLGMACYKFFNNHLLAFFIPELLLIAVHLTDIHYSLSQNISPAFYCRTAPGLMKNIRNYIIEVSVILAIIIVVNIIKRLRKKKYEVK